jgi:hypothetical protein
VSERLEPNDPVDSPAIEDSPNESIAVPGKMVLAGAASVIGFSRLSVEPPSAVAVAEQELQAASPTAVATHAARCFIPALMIPVIPPGAPSPAADPDPDEIPVVKVGQGTLIKRRGESRTQTRTTSRPTFYLSLWLLFFFSSPVHGITLNCINKTYPSSSCCSGEITLDSAVTTIAANAFDGCSELNGSLTIPSSVTTIGNSAFYGCSGFTGSLTLPSSVTTIGNYAFQHCYGFTGSLTIPSSVTVIGYAAFSGCYSFTGSLIIPSSVTTIGWYAFYNCYSLTLPSSVTTISDYAFQGCSGFIPTNVTGSLVAAAAL